MWQIEIVYQQGGREREKQRERKKRFAEKDAEGWIEKKTKRLSGTKLLQCPCTLFLPLLLGHPHVFLVGDL